jgi:hypothetical protein
MELEQPLSRYLHIHQNVVLPNHVNRDGRQYSALWAISRQTRLDMVTVHSLSTNETGHNLGCFSWVVFGLDAAMDFDWARSMEIRIGCVTDCCVNDMDDMGTWENLESLTIKIDKNLGISQRWPHRFQARHNSQLVDRSEQIALIYIVYARHLLTLLQSIFSPVTVKPLGMRLQLLKQAFYIKDETGL